MHKTLIGLMLALAAVPASGQSLDTPPMYLLGESDNPALTACQVSYNSTLGTVAAVLREDGVPLATERMAINGSALVLYVNINIAPLRLDDRPTTSCTGNVGIQIYIPKVMAEPISGVERRTALTYCTDSFNLTATRPRMQAEINTQIRELAAQCLNAYLEGAVVK